MWKKLTKGSGLNRAGKEARKTPAVSRSRSGAKIASLILPSGFVTAARADIYSDGNGKIAYAFSERGEYSVYTPTAKAKTLRVSIPKSVAGHIPYGTTDAVLTADGDMWVLDVSQFGLLTEVS